MNKTNRENKSTIALSGFGILFSVIQGIIALRSREKIEYLNYIIKQIIYMITTELHTKL